MLYCANASQLVLHPVVNRRCNQKAVCLLAVYRSLMTILNGRLGKTLGNTCQAGWLFASFAACPKQTIHMARFKKTEIFFNSSDQSAHLYIENT